MREALHHLNEHHAKCWLCRSNFLPLFYTYWSVSLPFIQFHRRFRRNNVQSHLRTFSGCVWRLFNYLRILRIQAITILLINVTTECAMCFSAEENFATTKMWLRRCKWWAGFSCYLSWILYGCRDRYKSKICHNVP